jgi:pyruvate,water dikinase
MAYIEWFDEGRLPRDRVGGKGASLAELVNAGFRVPDGFCITADGYRRFVEAGGIESRLEALIEKADLSTFQGVQAASEQLQAVLEEALLPDDLREQICEAYDALVEKGTLACAVRSSSISEDGAGSSFAGLYESYLNVRGAGEVLKSVRRCYASLWSERALRYRSHRDDGSGEDAMAVVVMGLVPSEVSGIAFTAHPVTGARDLVIINASWGLGEAVVSGRVTPDSFIVDKNTFAVLERQIFTVEQKIAADKRGVASLSDDQACEVARMAARVEAHYGSPQDVEWGMAHGNLYLLQSRPITTL